MYKMLAGMQCLKEDCGHVLGLLNEVLTSPVLPEEKISLNKSQVSLCTNKLHHCTTMSSLQCDQNAIRC